MTTSIFDRPKSLLRLTGALLAGLLACTACGLADDEQEDRDSRIYLTFEDEAFEAYCLSHFDTNGDGRFSRYEAQRVREMDCAGLGIASMETIGEFTRLERLDCSRNRLGRLDLTACTLLTSLDCTENRLTVLDVTGLRSLRTLDCRANLLPRLDLQSNGSVNRFDGRSNRFTTLDLSTCAADLQGDVRSNPDLTAVYYRAGQQIAAESPAELIRR